VSGRFEDLDPDDRELARRLSRADFSADSRVRESLRARLLARGRAPRRSPLAPALTAAALAALLVVPLRTFLLRTAARPRYARGEHGLPVLPGRFDSDAAGAPVVEETATGRRVVWNVDGDSYILESRRITADELFVVRRH